MKPRPINAKPPKAIEEANEQSSLRVFANETEESMEILVYDRIGEDFWTGEGVRAKDVQAIMATAKGKPVHVRINSFGGDVYDGFQIYNALASHDAEVRATVEGIAFSAASFIAMAGDTLAMYRTSDFGIHEASTVAIGNKREMKSAYDWLATIDEHLLDIYTAKTGKDREWMNQMLTGESDGTVFSAEEAKEHGFADEIVDPKTEKSDGKKDKAASAARQLSNRFRNRLRKAAS